MQEQRKMVVSVSKRHNAGNCKTDLADLPSFFVQIFSCFLPIIMNLLCTFIYGRRQKSSHLPYVQRNGIARSVPV